MIGFNHLGQIGRLGNQMFQCAGLVGVAEKRGFDYCIPDHSMHSEYGGYRYHELQSCFKMQDFENRYGYVDGDIVHLEQYHFCQDLLDECPDNCTLVGYFESEKYFKHVEEKIRKNYQFVDFIHESCYNYAKDYIKESGVAILVEGPGDVWRLEEAGIHNSLAVFGSSLTDSQQIILESSGALCLVLLFDTDSAGTKAKEKVQSSLSRMFNILNPDFPEGYKDIGEMKTEEVKEFLVPILEKLICRR